MTCSLEIAARIMHGGIDTCTLLVGRGICSSFAFPPSGQKLLSDSLLQLKGYPSIGKVLWFGFGIKNVVHILSETEQGAFCVSASAALAIPYNSFQAAQVWRAYCMLKGAPREFTPSIHQWKCLVDACAGSLLKSNFPHHFDEFSRTLAPQPSVSRSPAPPAELAKALATLGDLSQRKVSSAVFVGGVECAWLAAVAKCLLCLTIEIHDERDNCVYQWAGEQGVSVQAVFKPEIQNSGLTSSTTLVQRICFVCRGEELVHERVDFLTPGIRYRNKWSTILSDSFPHWKRFIESPAALYFPELLQFVAIHSEHYFSTSSPIRRERTDFPWWLYWNSEDTILYHPCRTGQELLQFAYKLFPELPGSPLLNVSEDTRGTKIEGRIAQTLQRIARSCNCINCHDTRHPASMKEFVCLQRLALAIVRLVLILSPVRIHEDIPPSPAALRQVYICTSGPTIVSGTLVPRSGIEIVLYLFTGQFLSNRSLGTESSLTGASVGGVCVFLSLLKGLSESPLDATTIEVIPGQIKHEERSYKLIADIEEAESGINMHPLLQKISDGFLSKGDFRFELIAEEMEDREILSVSYRASLPKGIVIWMRLAALQKHLRSCLSFHTCSSQGCPNSLQTNGKTHRWLIDKKRSSTASAEEEQNSFEFYTPSSWLLLDWNAWQLPKRGATSPLQHLDIDVYHACNETILLFLLVVHCRRHLEIGSGTFSKSLVMQAPGGENCIVRTTLSDWSKNVPEREAEGGRKPTYLSDILVMNNATKRLLIRNRPIDLGQHGKELAFDIVVEEDKRTPSLHKPSWNIFRRIS
jgi:hypothetical protein